MQFTPLSINQHTGEPYLRLPAPHQRIIITPPRLQHAPQLCEILNDRRIYRWISNPPFPYLMEHAVSWLTQIKGDADAIWDELQHANAESPEGPLKMMRGCPVRSILEENEDGSYTFLGDCTIERNRFEDVMDLEERAQLVKENNTRPVGDPDIIWSMGDYLRRSHHGKGIMTAIVGSLLKAWAVPRMNVRCLRVAVLEGNTGSVRVFEKNGFVLRNTVEDCIWMVTKGDYVGGPQAVHFLEWRRQ
ncbi:GNAT domain-containing protein [Russula compacta]|nr:GNAT domain-containing protein [Russula compacta]